MASELEPSVYEHFHQSEKRPQTVFTCAIHGGLPVFKADKVSCRRSALEFCEDPLPVFSPLDVFQPAVAGDNTADFYWVDKGPIEWTEALFMRHLGVYDGPRWYWRGAVRAALRYGAIAWADIKLSFKATAHLEAGFCKQIFKELDETWAAATGGTSKRVILPLIGLWNAPSQTQWSCETVSHDEDCTFSGKVRRRALDVPGFEHVYHDLVFKTDLLSYTSMRPIGQIALDMEGVFLRQLHEAVRPMLYNRCKPYKVVGACVDCIHYQVPRKLARDIGRMLEKSCRHADGTAKYHWSEEAPPQREVSASWRETSSWSRDSPATSAERLAPGRPSS